VAQAAVEQSNQQEGNQNPPEHAQVALGELISTAAATARAATAVPRTAIAPVAVQQFFFNTLPVFIVQRFNQVTKRIPLSHSIYSSSWVQPAFAAMTRSVGRAWIGSSGPCGTLNTLALLYQRSPLVHIFVLFRVRS